MRPDYHNPGDAFAEVLGIGPTWTKDPKPEPATSAPPAQSLADFSPKWSKDTPAATVSKPAGSAAAGGMGGMGMGVNYGQGIQNLFEAGGDIMQQEADKEAAAREAQKAKEQKVAIDKQFEQVQRQQELERQLAATRPGPEAQARLKLATARANAVQSQRAAFYQKFPDLAPKPPRQGMGQNTLLIAGAVVVAGALGWFAWGKK